MTAAITGVGALASVGNNADELFDSLCAERSGMAELRAFDRTKYQAQHLFEIDDRSRTRGDVPRRATRFLLQAIDEALADADVDGDLTNVPILVGTGLRELRSVELWWLGATDFRAEHLHFGTELRDRLGAADTHTFSGACSASLYASALAHDLLALGAAKTVVVAGVDVITESMFGLSDRFQPVPPGQVLPLDSNRRGTILGEGAGALVLSSESSLGDRSPRAWLRSVSANCDGYHSTAPAREGISDSIRQAHERAGIKPSDIDLVMLHGTGTPLNDQVEIEALQDVFLGDSDRPLITGIKSMTGHTSGAAGALSLVTVVRSLETDAVPPIAATTDPIPETSRLRLVRNGTTTERTSVAEVHGFGFGGVNAVAVLEAARQ